MALLYLSLYSYKFNVKEIQTNKYLSIKLNETLFKYKS